MEVYFLLIVQVFDSSCYVQSSIIFNFYIQTIIKLLWSMSYPVIINIIILSLIGKWMRSNSFMGYYQTIKDWRILYPWWHSSKNTLMLILSHLKQVNNTHSSLESSKSYVSQNSEQFSISCQSSLKWLRSSLKPPNFSHSPLSWFPRIKSSNGMIIKI